MELLNVKNVLLFIEPKVDEKLEEPVEDGLSDILETLISNAKTGVIGLIENEEANFVENLMTKGIHVTECGEASSNVDYLLPNGMITNRLAPYYLKWYRNSISENEMNKVYDLLKYLGIQN